MRSKTLLSVIGCSSAAVMVSGERSSDRVYKHPQPERELSGSEDGEMMSFDDDFWAYDQGSMETMWDDYSIQPEICMVYNKKHVIAYQLYGKGNNSCAKKSQGNYIMEVGQFARAYVAQRQIDYNFQGNYFGNPESLDYLECTAVEYNDNYYYTKLGCNQQGGGLKLIAYNDEYCKNEYSGSVGLYNDLKIMFQTCHSCVSWPSQDADAYDDAYDPYADLDDNFQNYHAYDSKLCSAAEEFKSSCGWGCKKQVKKGLAQQNSNAKHGWNGFEKFCLFFWSAVGVGLVWIVLKQRRLMSREDAIVEEAAMNGIGLKKRHVFPVALGIIFLVLFSMFMVWKKLTWFLLLGTNVGLSAHFVYLRRKAKKAGGGGDGYVKDAGLEIS